LFPYTTLFRSYRFGGDARDRHVRPDRTQSTPDRTEPREALSRFALDRVAFSLPDEGPLRGHDARHGRGPVRRRDGVAPDFRGGRARGGLHGAWFPACRSGYRRGADLTRGGT